MDSLNKNHNDLIISYLSGNASDSDIELLRNWILQSDEHKNEFIQIKTTWLAAAQVARNTNFDTQKALFDFNHKIGAQNKKLPAQTSYRLKHLLKIAAAFLLMFMLGSLGTYLMMKGKEGKNTEGKLIFVYAPKGGKAMTVLPDGTKVWLNAGSNLSYNPVTYGQEARQVTLIGEGFFSVITNPQKPFVVSAKDLKIKALGTEFNVKAYPEENTIEATLVKGIVKVEGTDRNLQSFVITMNPKQKITFYSGKALIDKSPLTDPSKVEGDKLSQIKLESLPANIPVKPIVHSMVKPDLYTSWKDDKWIFEGEEIGKLAILLERRFNVSITFDAEELKHYKFTGTFQKETLEQILKVLKLTAPLQYKVGKGNVELMLDTELTIKYKKYMND
jgi:transmembrane sensor